MKRTTLSALAPIAPMAAALSCLAGAVSANAGLEAYLARVDAAEASFGEACEDIRAEAPPEGRVWLRLGADGIEIAPADEAAASAAAFWAEAALGARATAERLYGQAVGEGLRDAPVMIETRATGVTVHDGKAMALGDPCDALERVVAALGPGAPGDPFAAARGAATSPERMAVPIGGAAERALTTAPDGALARGPVGVTAEIVETDEGRVLRMTAGPDAQPGESTARIYAPDDRFTPIETIPLAVLPGNSAPDPSAAPALSPGGAHEGAVRVSGEDAITVTVTDAGRIAFASSGETDVRAVLESDTGEVIAADDDSGEGYGFAFEADLPPGRYTLRLRHCCGGGGRYSVTATIE